MINGISTILKRATWRNPGICYGTARFEKREDAESLAKLVKAEGRTANGGMFDGMPLGHITKGPDGWSVTY